VNRFENVQFCSWSRNRKHFTAGIPGIFQGLKIETDAELLQKGAFIETDADGSV
jgi:hypothetical protein